MAKNLICLKKFLGRNGSKYLKGNFMIEKIKTYCKSVPVLSWITLGVALVALWIGVRHFNHTHGRGPGKPPALIEK